LSRENKKKGEWGRIKNPTGKEKGVSLHTGLVSIREL
jgi:hypothetical protein